MNRSRSFGVIDEYTEIHTYCIENLSLSLFLKPIKNESFCFISKRQKKFLTMNVKNFDHMKYFFFYLSAILDRPRRKFY